MQMPIEQLERQAREDASSALTEDMGPVDLSAVAAGAGDRACASVICRSGGILCGKLWFEASFLWLDGRVEFDWQLEEGEQLSPMAEVVRLEGMARALLSAERTALNFLQTLSGTATAARELCDSLPDGNCDIRLLDTRKTLPLLRLAQKYATAVGGMVNHRMGLWDMAMVKENHIAAAGSLTEAVRRIREASPDAGLMVEVEHLEQLEEALAAGVSLLLLDNFSDADILRAVDMAAGRAQIEVSGNVDADRIPALAGMGVHRISCGAVTKDLSVPDFSMQLKAG